MTIDIETLFTLDTAATLLNKGLDLAQAVGLPVTSWRVGDPTGSLYSYLAEVLANLEGQRGDYVRSAFLSSASGDWLTVVASDVYGVDRGLDAPSTPSVVLHNAGGGNYPIEVGDLTFKCKATGATFHNTSGGTLAPTGGADLTLTLVADVDGTAGTVSANDVDTLVTTRLGVSVVSSTAAVGVDAQSDDALKQDCRDTRGALSPNGPADAYEYVVRNAELTGVSTITRSRSTSDSTTGHVTVYVAGPSGTTDGASVAAAQTAVEKWATPLCITPTVVAATADTIAVTATISGTDIPADFLARLTAALGALFAASQIADESGDTLRRSPIIAKIHATLALSNVVLTLPAADVAYAAGHCPALGAVTITEA